MKHLMAIATLVLAAAAAHAQTPQKSSAECGVKLAKDPEMGFTQCDQTRGWLARDSG